MEIPEYIKIISCDDYEWYKDCIGEIFKVHSESRKGGKDKWVVRLTQEQRKYMNGYSYGWVSKNHCEEIKTKELYQKA